MRCPLVKVNSMFNTRNLMGSQPIVWTRNSRGGPGYEDRAVGRVVRTGVGRVTILVYRASDETWVIRSVGPLELEPATGTDLAHLEALERQDRRPAA